MSRGSTLGLLWIGDRIVGRRARWLETGLEPRILNRLLSSFMVAFVDSRGLPPLPSRQYGTGGRVVATTEVGVDVHCGGPASDRERFEPTAREVAQDLRRRA